MITNKETETATHSLAALRQELDILKEKCAFLEKVVHEVPANIYISDLEKGVVWCNKTNEETLGYTLDDILQMGGMHYFQEIVHPEDLNIPEDSIDHYHHSPSPQFGGIFRARHKHASTYVWYMGWSKPFALHPDGSTRQIICVDVDMSQQMNTDSQLTEALKENLRIKNKLLIKSLRKREIEVLQLICRGMSTNRIAEALFISANTVSTHRKNIQKKLGTRNVADLVTLAREAGLG
ncbi:LuxR C-terminal-related transcriptional regulator [Pontibacter sp. E15-1]|uniref:LuxR C-terminal-related transcriptional regulator n=1 Tax=Pontibacter sp. E15-1 TaxID=2919918 RepID=UPI001F4FA43D|nr:LuxR C-terminal-related transcriptional regulator [Pontibacter sp. E15-1]MCJ8167393.1 LuxR C-terminal-related transcriptional regulator [Pontibacter sp. E15-1]